MRPTQGISYPRSGHSAVYHIAKHYFGDSLVYCSRHQCGCATVPCANPARTFAKNHDLDLRTSSGIPPAKRYWTFAKNHDVDLPTSSGIPILPAERYFIQYRSPARSIVSNFQLYCAHHPDRCDRKHWEDFAYRQIQFWNRFIDKWVLNFPADHQAPLYLTYEALMRSPEASVRDVLAFLSDGPLDDQAVARAIEAEPIALRDRLADFEFYDPALFRKLEAAAADRLARLDLPSFTDELGPGR